MKRKKKTNRNFVQLTLQDRINIEINYRNGLGIRDIARKMNRDASVISREINGKPSRGVGKYQAYVNHGRALKRRLGKKKSRLKNEFIRSYVKEKMKLGWSPEQISIRLPIDHPSNTISHEAIYQFVYAQVKRGGNGKVKKGCEDLRPYLPWRHKRRQRKGFRQAQRAERQYYLPLRIGRLSSIKENESEIGKMTL